MTTDETLALVDALRARGVRMFEGHGIKVVLEPERKPATLDPDRPVKPPRSLESRLFDPLGITKQKREPSDG